MAQFLRDNFIKNITVDEGNLRQINDVFASRTTAINNDIAVTDTTGKRAFFTYIIRFDNKGYRVFLFDDLLRYFHQAKVVERIIFSIETGEALKTNRQVGTYMELRLDEKDPNLCLLTVASDNGDWVDASFAGIQDVLDKCKNWNRWARTDWTQFAIQIFGVAGGFVLSLWAAAKIAPHLEISNPFVISFLFALLMFSNVWTYLNQRIIQSINRLFPNMKFYRPRKDQMHWFLRTLIGGIAVALTIWVLNLVFAYVGNVIGNFIKD